MTDNLKKIKCPACGEEMVKIYMPQQGVNLDVCINGCGGIYFDNREFAKFDEESEDISPFPSQDGGLLYCPIILSLPTNHVPK